MEFEDNNKKFSGEEFRNEVISKLSLAKQFSVRKHLSAIDKLDKEQAKEMLREAIVHLAYKDYTFEKLMKNNWIDKDGSE